MSADEFNERDRPSEPTTDAGSDTILAFADRLRAGAETQEDAKETYESWVTFRVSTRTLALPVAHVREILRLPELTGVPKRSPGRSPAS